MGMNLYRVEYGFMARTGNLVYTLACLADLHSGSETEALAWVKQRENGRWRSYGEGVEVVILKVTPA
jgi:hypothetical protein